MAATVMKLEELLATVTPWRCTSWGSLLSTWLTRLFTLTAAISRLVPTSKVMLMDTAPSPEEVEFM